MAELKCKQWDREFGLLFRKQYVLSRDHSRNYPGWKKVTLKGWTLHHGDALRVTPIVDLCGENIGYLLGHALAAEGKAIAESFQIRIDSEKKFDADRISEAINASSN